MGINFRDAWANFGEDKEEKEAKAGDTKWGNLKDDLLLLEEKQKTRGVELLLKMKDLSHQEDGMGSLFTDIVRASVNYLSTMDRLSTAKLDQREGKMGVDDRESYDKARTSAHNNLISCINILARECQKRGLDTDWRHVLGSDRTDITRWVLSVADHIQHQILHE
jgi:hypothetical protein